MLPEVTSDWIFYGLSGLFVAYLLVIFLTRRPAAPDPVATASANPAPVRPAV